MHIEKVNEADFDDPAFEYVVEIREGDKVSFGTGLVRNTSPIGKGLSPYQKRMVCEQNTVAPGQYNLEMTSAMYAVLNKVRSKAGVGGLASKAPRQTDKIHLRTPSPGRYEVQIKWGAGRKSKVPLGGKGKIREMKVNKYPGPGTYDTSKAKCRRTRFMYNFGRPSMIHSIETVCVAIPSDTCHKCNTLCQGDYWHKDYTKFLCQLCWDEEKRSHEVYNEAELKQLKKIRNCSFMHSHEDTTAAVRILPQNKINKKIRLENYLDLYIKC